MKNRLFFVLTLLLIVGQTLSAQSLLDLFTGSKPDNKIRVKFLEGDEEAEDEILLISLKGPIYDNSNAEPMPFSIQKDMLSELKKDLEVVRKREAVKAILLEINSPGGEVTASDIIYHQLKKIQRDTKKPVIALIGAMGASGGYYIACAAEKIYSHPTSLIGSIGVLMQAFNIEKLAKTIGIQSQFIKSERTPKKDVLSPFKKMTEEEHKMLVILVDSIYDRFVDIVSENRKMKRDDVIKVADGGIFSSQQAKEYGLIDSIGYREDAMAEICKIVDIKSAALVRRVTNKSFSELISGMAKSASFFPSISGELKRFIMENSAPTLFFK